MRIFVSEMFNYPLKSGHRTDARNETAYVTPTGFNQDRKMMLVHAEGLDEGKFISQRAAGFEKLAEVRSSLHRNLSGAYQPYWEFNVPGNTFYLGLEEIAKSHVDVRVWGSECKGLDAGKDAAKFFSDYLAYPVRLIFYPENAPRGIDEDYGQSGDITSYADGFPFLITTEPSLHSLQEHFVEGAGINMHRFRPNIVLDGNLPWQEDVMHEIQIGDVRFEMVKPCARCVMTTIDQDTGERGAGDPLTTLAKLRRGKGQGLQGVFFGQNAIPRSLGKINIGDEVEIISTRPLHPALEQAQLKFGM